MARKIQKDQYELPSATDVLPSQSGQSGKYLKTNGSAASWEAVTGSGDVVGPSSATDNAVPLYDGTTGKLLKNGTMQMTTASGTTTLRAITGNTALATSSGSTNVSGTTVTISAATGALNLNADTVVNANGSQVATISDAQTLTNKRVTPRVSTTTSSATPTINTNSVDIYGLTAQAVDITSFTTNLSGTPTDGQKLQIYIVGTATRNITWGSSFEDGASTLPTATPGTTRLDVMFVWNAATSKWRCMATNSASVIISGTSKITVGTTAPSSPSTGDLWVDTN